MSNCVGKKRDEMEAETKVESKTNVKTNEHDDDDERPRRSRLAEHPHAPPDVSYPSSLLITIHPPPPLHHYLVPKTQPRTTHPPSPHGGVIRADKLLGSPRPVSESRISLPWSSRLDSLDLRLLMPRNGMKHHGMNSKSWQQRTRNGARCGWRDHRLNSTLLLCILTRHTNHGAVVVYVLCVLQRPSASRSQIRRKHASPSCSAVRCSAVQLTDSQRVGSRFENLPACNSNVSKKKSNQKKACWGGEGIEDERGGRVGRAKDWTKSDLGLMNWVMFRGCQWLSYLLPSPPARPARPPTHLHTPSKWQAGLAGLAGHALQGSGWQVLERACSRAGRWGPLLVTGRVCANHLCLDQPIPLLPFF